VRRVKGVESAKVMLKLLLIMAGAVCTLRAQYVFERDVQPLLQKYCLACHSAAKHTGDINLEQFLGSANVPRHPGVWQKVAEQLNLGEMPPKAMPQPTAAERLRLIEWTRATLKQAARARAGDPGPVVLRRLNNAEYTYTIRDLTRVPDLDPVKEFPADGAAGEGFTNVGNALAMSPALLKKYLDAAKDVARHAVLLPNGLRFSSSISRNDWTNETLAEIRAFYARFTEAGGAETVKQQGIDLDKNRGGVLPLRKYLTASLRIRAGQSVASVARAESLSPKYLASLVQLMSAPAPSPLLDGLRRKWRRGDVDGVIEEIEPWQQALWKFSSVGHIGKVDGPKAWMEPVTPVVASQEFRVKLAAPASGNEVKLYLAADDAGDGAAGDSVIWREPRLTIPGRPPVRLRDVRGLVRVLTEQRREVVGATAKALNAAAELESGDGVPVAAKQAWFDYLGLTGGIAVEVEHLTSQIKKAGTYEFIQGWGGGKLPSVLANATAQAVRIPGQMKPHGVAVLPASTHYAAVGWRSPAAATLRVEATVTPANAECGNGVAWSLELRRGGMRLRLAEGISHGAKAIEVGPFERVAVRTGDYVSLLIGPRDGNASCDLTDLEFKLASAGGQDWSLTRDVAGKVLAGNPQGGVWHFYSEPVAGAGSGTIIPAGSLLMRWLVAEKPEEKRQLAEALQQLLSAAAPAANTPDGELHRQLSSLAGPLFSRAVIPAATDAESPWGVDPAKFAGADMPAQAPSLIEVTLPADLVAGAEFSVTGALEAKSEGTVQLQVLTAKPDGPAGLRPSGTLVRTADGTWTSNNQRVSYAMPVVVNEGSAARHRVEAAFDEFRQMFPASLCYTKIVPVDEVVTLTLYHREDKHLGRLLLSDVERAELDRLWEQLWFISRAPIALVDVFEQLWQYATQDADPSKFEPMRRPIQERAAAFRRQQVAAEPKHLEAVLEFADRAYRRAVTVVEKDELRSLYARLRAQESPHEEAVRLTLGRVLVGPAFLYRTERAAPPTVRQAPVSDAELASRLSYFLWSSQPDAELRRAAAAGQLRTPAGLAAQAHRMLCDERVRRLATEFGASWLHIHGFDSLDEKSERHFPEFRSLRGAMYEESILFLTDLFRGNRPLLSLLDADHSFLNEPLANFYGITGVKGEDWRRVEGLRAQGRGGVLGLAATLAKQSGASRTSPILRGNWVAEVLLGDKLPRPPKDVPQLPEDEANLTLTMRELTEKHTSDARCAACHRRIDPYGYALEQFDAIGRRRGQDLGGRAIHTKTRLMDGTQIEGLEGLRQYLMTQGRDKFVRQFCRKLLGYALGRAVQLSDEPLLDVLQTQSSVGGVVDLIVRSKQFREIRGRGSVPEE